MNWTPEFAFERFTQHLDTIGAAEGANEATTRMRAIDTLVFDVLGWDKMMVETELYCRAEGFADYALKSEPSVCLIIEAKRAGETFVLPGRRMPDTPVGFPLLAKECPAAEAALRQALGYAASTGARYIAITNGYQWLVTLTFIPNQPITERSVYVFESLDAIGKKFRQFWDCFSPEGVFSNRPANALMESRKAPPPSKLAQRIPNYPVPSSRNLIVNELSAVLSGVWDEVRHDEEEEAFLKECYVEPDTTEASIAQATELLQQRLGTDERIRAKALKTETVPELVQQDRTPEKPIVVLGKVGHGKTTFLRYLRTIKAKAVLDKYIQIQIDFLDRPSSAADVARFVYAQVEEQLRENYGIDVSDDGIVRAALHSDLARFKRSPEAKAYPKESLELHLVQNDNTLTDI